MARQLTIDDYLKYEKYDEMANKWAVRADRLQEQKRRKRQQNK